jgi:hypothetical protein
MRITQLLRIVVFLNLAGGPVVFAQQDTFLLGRLLDSDSGEGVAFATIRLEGKAIGVVSNEDGSFQIPERFSKLGELLNISSMGYESLRIPVADLHSDIVNNLLLHPAIFELKEAVVKATRIRKRSARNIVRTAIRKIPDNYPESPFGLIGYYRDYQKKPGKYLNLNEAILEVYDAGFNSNDLENTQVRIYDYKPNANFPVDTLASSPYDYQRWQKVISNAYLYNYGGNEFTILRMHDAIRNYKINTFSFVEQMERDLLKNHSFKREDDTYLGNEPLYVISLSTRKGFYRAEGTMLISRWDFAIHRMNYAVYDGSVLFPNGSKVYAGDKAGRLMFEVKTEYRRKGRRMFLNYISFRNNFKLAMPPKFAVDSVAADIGCGCFRVYFNNIPSSKTALNLSHYKAVLQGKNVKLAEAIVVDSSVVLYLPPNRRHLLKTLTKYSGKEVGGEEAKLSITGVQDTDGNLADVSEKLDILQFREFFTQQILEKPQLQADSLYMLRQRPIFKDQPIARPDNFEEYWMNTPLQDSN